ncbi:MAG: exodeoxyribonuclease VII small subunit [Oxalobacter sp.]|nr:exodeoxyribonuclease VII small subunit [Oxalobacter sp.]
MSTVDIGQLPASYEEAVKELEQLVARMEAGELSLEQSIEAYKRGATLIQFCTTKLDKVEQQVRVLDKDIFKPFQPTDETEK